MSTVVDTPLIRASEFEVTDDALVAVLDDGRVIMVPIWWYWRLEQATPEQRKHYKLHPTRTFVHWPDIDEDIGIEDMIKAGAPPRPYELPSPNQRPIKWKANLDWVPSSASSVLMWHLMLALKTKQEPSAWFSSDISHWDWKTILSRVYTPNLLLTREQDLDSIAEHLCRICTQKANKEGQGTS